MTADRGKLPLVAIIVSVVMILVGFVFAFMLFSRPGTIIAMPGGADAGVSRLIFMMGTRSLTMAIALLLALIFKSRLGLIAVLGMRVATELLDIVAGLSFGGGPGTIVVAAIMVLGELAAIYFLVRSLRAAPAA